MKKIMLVDDSKITLKKMKRLFEELGHNIVTFTNPLEAIDEYKEHHELYLMVISDFHMLEANGDELVRQIRAFNKTIPLVICTADVQDTTREMVEGIGADMVINKPDLFNKDKITEIVNSLGKK